MLAGVASETSRSIKPRELDLRSLRLFVLVRFLTRPTNHPRHAACASNDESKPVRPLSNTKHRPLPQENKTAYNPRSSIADVGADRSDKQLDLSALVPT